MGKEEEKEEGEEGRGKKGGERKAGREGREGREGKMGKGRWGEEGGRGAQPDPSAWRNQGLRKSALKTGMPFLLTPAPTPAPQWGHSGWEAFSEALPGGPSCPEHLGSGWGSRLGAAQR